MPHDIRKTISDVLFNPFSLPEGIVYPSVSLSFLTAALLLVTLGVISAPAVALKPLMVALVVVFVWGFLVSVLVLVCSFLGMSLKWKEGGRILSLAGLPTLLKLAGGCVFAVATSLSPFLFTASPRLFFRTAPYWIGRLDAFELWTIGLLWLLLRKRTGGSDKMAAVATACVWMAAIALLWGLQKLSGTP